MSCGMKQKKILMEGYQGKRINCCIILQLLTQCLLTQKKQSLEDCLGHVPTIKLF